MTWPNGAWLLALQPEKSSGGCFFNHNNINNHFITHWLRRCKYEDVLMMQGKARLNTTQYKEVDGERTRREFLCVGETKALVGPEDASAVETNQVPFIRWDFNFLCRFVVWVAKFVRAMTFSTRTPVNLLWIRYKEKCARLEKENYQNREADRDEGQQAASTKENECRKVIGPGLKRRQQKES